MLDGRIEDKLIEESTALGDFMFDEYVQGPAWRVLKMGASGFLADLAVETTIVREGRLAGSMAMGTNDRR